jgi:hypothetical protein
MSILTAQVSPIQIGNFTFEGLIFQDSSFGIAIQQAANLFSVPQNNAQRDFKALLGAGFQFLKIQAKRAERQNRPENALSLIDFEKLLRQLDRKGNKQAQAIVDDLIGLSLHQLFADAFNQKFEKEDRQVWLINRQATKTLFQNISEQTSIWYDATKADRSQSLDKYCINVSNCINKGLFGKDSKAIKIDLGLNVADNQLIRDYFNSEALRRIAQIESIAVNKLKLEADLRPVDAVKFALSVSNFEVLASYKNTGDN